MSSTARKSDARGAKSASERMAAYRRRKRAAGLRQVQLWVPDLRRPEILAEYQRQARLIAQGDPAGDEVMEWIEQVYEWPEYDTDKK